MCFRYDIDSVERGSSHSMTTSTRHRRWLRLPIALASACALGWGLLALPAVGIDAAASGEHGEVVRWGRLGVLNNQWGAALGHADAASYQRLRVEPASVAFEFDWRNKAPEDAVWVKAFPAIVAGWHYGVPVYPGDPALPNLPVQLASRPALATSVRALRAGGTESDVMNLAWDVWLTRSKPDPRAVVPVAPAAEIMVWPWRQHQGPLTLEGSSTRACAREGDEKVDSAPIATNIPLWSRTWDLYFGCASDGHVAWPVLSFVVSTPLASPNGPVVVSGRLGDFIGYASTNTRQSTTIEQSWWVAGVEFGSEIIQGAGTWTITNYRMER
jgi:hypothetical protein